ncbi:MAG: DUF485 domain-containing protein [Planctomycetia bacterium]
MDRAKSQASGRSSGSSRVGLVLFWVYVSLYAGFIGLVLFRPDLLGARPLAGVNLAIVYGFGLIAGAFLLAVVYMVACRVVERDAASRRR